MPLCIAFYCQLDLQWENYTMLVFCFNMLLFLIFQNIRNLLLYVMAEKKYFLPWSISLRQNEWLGIKALFSFGASLDQCNISTSQKAEQWLIKPNNMSVINWPWYQGRGVPNDWKIMWQKEKKEMESIRRWIVNSAKLE